MLHEPAAPSGDDPASTYKTRLGVWLFVLYAAVYVGFVAINIGAPALMARIVGLGLNLATVYGLFLIVFAFVLALIYNQRCSAMERKLAAAEPVDGGR